MMTKKQKQKQITKRNNHDKSTPEPAKELTFIEHIHEVRGRLTWIIVSLIAASTVAYQFREQLVNLVVAPLHGEKLIYLNPGGGFTFIFTVCLYFGALITIPVVMYHLYSFLQPVIGRRSRRLIVGIVLTSMLLAMTGIGFGYILVIPGAIHFLGGFAGEAVVASLTTDAYLNFTVMHLFGMAALFQLPLLLFIIDHIRPLPPGMLFKLQRWVIAGSIIAAAVITPTPDPANLFLVALPIIGIYQIGVVIVWLRRRSHHANRRSSLQTTEDDHVAKHTHPSVLAAQIDPPTQVPAFTDVQKRAVQSRAIAQSSPAVVMSHNTQQATTRKSMDGIARTSRTASPKMTVPERRRDIHQTSVVQRSDIPVSSRRTSIDGLSMI